MHFISCLILDRNFQPHRCKWTLWTHYDNNKLVENSAMSQFNYFNQLFLIEPFDNREQEFNFHSCIQMMRWWCRMTVCKLSTTSCLLSLYKPQRFPEFSLLCCVPPLKYVSIMCVLSFSERSAPSYHALLYFHWPLPPQKCTRHSVLVFERQFSFTSPACFVTLSGLSLLYDIMQSSLQHMV